MIIQDLFSKDINRNINGVVKVSQDDEASISQELSEYVVTRELQRHFSDFFENYSAAIDAPTDRIGVWISGFFGSGKSHFLKMLSYLLANREIAGIRPIDYFEGKIEDLPVYAKMKRACDIPTEAILFNIDDKASQWKEGDTAKTALLRAFARVFYEHRGFEGSNLRTAQLEEHIDLQGKTNEFRAAFERISGESWLESRGRADFFEDDVADALQEALGWSEQQARNQAGALLDDAAIAPEDLVDEIAAYVDKQAAQNDGQFRLLFMVDEVGQFIGSDVNLMLNLQTLVEDLGARCGGKVWVMVTSQEAIDEVTKVAGNDFSKIQGRFNTRLSLSSSSVDEVIKRRVLDKTDVAHDLLEREYDIKAPVLKNLFSFEGESRSDLIGYRSAQDFQESYPFVGYQFMLMRDVLKQIRVHGNSGKHLSGGERSMLSGFQESAQAVQAGEVGTLVPLWRFYDSFAEFLEHDIRQVIDRCQRAAEDAAGIEVFDVAVLKTLFLIRYINDIKPTEGNIAILLVENMDVDKVALRQRVADSLARLVRQNYVGQTDKTYQFLTNEEQDISREIRETQVDSANVVARINKIIFDDIFTQPKVRVGAADYPFDRYVDDTRHGQVAGGMKLEIVTLANALSSQEDEALAMRSQGQALVRLSNEGDYYEVLENAAKITAYVNTQKVPQLPESKQAIIRKKQKEANAADAQARQLIERAIVNATVAVAGRVEDVRATSAKDKLEKTLTLLANVVYSKANLIGAPIGGEADIVDILRGKDNRQDGLAGTGGGNQEADACVEQYLQAQSLQHVPTSLTDVQKQFQKAPYGWREQDISACCARLAFDKKAEFKRAGVTLELTDSKLPTYLLRRSEWERVSVIKREKADEVLVKRVLDVLKDMELEGTAPADEDGLASYAVEQLEAKLEWARGLLANEYAKAKYPGRDQLVDAIAAFNGVLESKGDRIALFNAIAKADDDLVDAADDLRDLAGFFPNQQRIYNDALALADLMENEQEQPKADVKAMEALASVRNVLAMAKPYREIGNLNKHIATVSNAHAKLVAARKTQLLEDLKAACEAIEAYASDKPAAAAVLQRLATVEANRREQINAAGTIETLDAQAFHLNQLRDEQYKAIDDAVDAAEEKAKREAAAAATKRTHVDERTGDKVTTMRVPTQAPAAPAAPKPTREKTLNRADVCPSHRLRSEADVDRYVSDIREKLLAALKEADYVRLG